jgi:hypothetical protein
VLYHLILSVNLTDSYTLFIMNPKKAVGSDQTYGYRCAPSSAPAVRCQRSLVAHTTSLLCAHWPAASDSRRRRSPNCRRYVGASSGQQRQLLISFAADGVLVILQRTAEWSVDPQRFQTVSEMPGMLHSAQRAEATALYSG